MEDYDKIKKVLALGFMNFLDENRPEGKMCLSNWECADIEKAFNEQDWPKLARYLDKYLFLEEKSGKPMNPDDAMKELDEKIALVKQEQPKVDLEKIIEHTYHDGSVTDTDDIDHVTYENIARHFYELGKNSK